MAESIRNPSAHKLTVEERKRLTVCGVQDVDQFDDNEVIVQTDLGKLVIAGSGLHLIRLMPETGELEMAGEIRALQYRSGRNGKGGALARLLK
ncbi:MAG: YabP/YqfC family sporulation protein [Clostridia bacterium]|nr:YabP/YqfC family sporulation protein [Clostridia bacterium]